MKNLMILILVFLFFNSVNTPRIIGWYNPNTDEIWCTTQLSCWHEEAHRLDKELGYPSQTIEFKKEIDKIPVIFTVQQIGEKYAEAYAWFWAFEDGNINKVPEWFKKFYQKDIK
jgi:hypothetical protein